MLRGTTSQVRPGNIIVGILGGQHKPSTYPFLVLKDQVLQRLQAEQVTVNNLADIIVPMNRKRFEDPSRVLQTENYQPMSGRQSKLLDVQIEIRMLIGIKTGILCRSIHKAEFLLLQREQFMRISEPNNFKV